MLGRAAYHEPWRLLAADPLFFGEPAPFASPFEVALALEPYIARHVERGGKLSNVTRHTLGLFQAVPGARRFRRILAENAHKEEAGLEVWRAALAALRPGDQVSAVAAE